ncbi:MAG: MBL fold metallo-hydrolase [Desulfobacterales bacterium]|jgi:phosphoribosyl 1,2-cyclic phosphodiesterase
MCGFTRGGFAAAAPFAITTMSNCEKTNGPFTVCALASGSRGNAIYLSAGSTAILVDAGLSGVELERRMRSRGLCPDRLDALLVSHEHADHIQGVGVLSRRYKLPVFMTEKTRGALPPSVGKIADIRTFASGRSFSIDGLRLEAFPVSHDASEPSGFIFSRNGLKIGLATDLGIATALVRERLRGCRLLILETNHDRRMLEEGPYPWPLKQRIQSRLGHLCNEASRDLLAALVHDGLSHVILAHLSQTNNTPEKALAAVAPALNASRAKLTVALQDVPGEVVVVG